MKRIFWGSVRAVCGFGILVGLALASVGAPARAQGAPGSRAQVSRVTGGNFTVPQVKLADAAVARRIKRALLRLVIGANAAGAIDSTRTPRQQLGQADRDSRYDEDEKVWRSVGQGFIGSDYAVLLNQDFLLSFAFTVEYMGAYPSQATQHATFDLRTGRCLQLADLIADPPAQLVLRMQGAVNRRMGEALAGVAAGDDSTEVTDLTERFHWNKTTRRVNFEAAGQQEATAAIDLEEFALTPRVLLLFYRVGLPHVMLNYEPDDTYRFPYARVHPRGPLVPIAKAAGALKKP